MSNTNTGGSAFPFVDYDCHGDIMDIHSGMTLRDYFAVEAMQAEIVGAQGIDRRDLNVECQEIPETAYKMADALLQARE